MDSVKMMQHQYNTCIYFWHPSYIGNSTKINAFYQSWVKSFWFYVYSDFEFWLDNKILDTLPKLILIVWFFFWFITCWFKKLHRLSQDAKDAERKPTGILLVYYTISKLNVNALFYLRQNIAAFEKRMIFVLLTRFECDREEFWIKNMSLY